MNKLKIIFLTVFCFVSFHSMAQTNSGWVLKKDIKHAYRVEFPVEPESQETNVATAKGDIMMYSYLANDTGKTKNFIYMTSTSDYPTSWFPNGIDTPEKENELLNNCVSGAVANVKGTLVYSREAEHNGFKGKKARIHITSGGADYTINIKCFLVGYKLYMLQTISKKVDEGNQDIDKFFNSFELIKVRS